MSLINKVLQDLETRRGACAPMAERSVYEGLRPVRLAPPPAPRRGLWAGVLLGALVVAAAGLYLHGRSGQESPLVSAPPEVARPAVASLAASAPPTETGARSPTVASPDASGAVTSTAPAHVATTEQAAATAQIGGDHSAPATALAEQPISAKADPPPASAPRVVASAKRVSPAPPAQRRSAPAAAGEPEKKGTVEKVIRPLSASERADGHYRQAVRYLQQGHAGRAEEELRSALALDGTHATARELLAGMLIQRGRWREAQVLLEDGLAIAPHPVLARLLARLHLEHGAEGSALAVMEQARPVAARNGEFLAFLAMLYQRAGRHDDAIAAYTEAVGLRPADGRAWLGLAIALEARERPGEAMQAYEHALASGGLDAGLRQYAQQRLAALKK